jgi:hypothetical protein
MKSRVDLPTFQSSNITTLQPYNLMTFENLRHKILDKRPKTLDQSEEFKKRWSVEEQGRPFNLPTLQPFKIEDIRRETLDIRHKTLDNR